MGSDYNTSGAMKPRRVLDVWQKYLPTLSTGINSTVPGTAMSQLQASNTTMNPDSTGKPLGLNELNLQQMGSTLPRFLNLGAENAAGLNVINRALNPEYFTSAGAASTGAKNLLGAINLGGLSPGEAASVERGLNQYKTSTGNAGLLDPTNIISDAINFGGAFNSKLGIYGNALSNATQTANATANNGNFNPTGAATQFGTGQFVNAASPVTGATPASNAFQFGLGTLGTLGGANNAAQAAGAQMAGQTSPAAYLNSTSSILGNL